MVSLNGLIFPLNSEGGIGWSITKNVTKTTINWEINNMDMFGKPSKNWILPPASEQGDTSFSKEK